MQRITESQLNAIVLRINESTGSPINPYKSITVSALGCMSNIGNYHLSFAYGGVSLHRMVNERGGVNDVFGCGHLPKLELANRMWAFLAGIEAGKTKLEALTTA